MNILTDEKLDLTKIIPRGGNSDLSELEQDLFKLLADVVQPGNTITPQAAAETIDEYLRSLPGRTEEKKEDVKVVEDFLHTLWSLLIAVVENTPYNHPGQDRLLATLTSLIKRSEGSYEIWGQSALHVWADLPLLGPIVRENWGWTAPSTTKASYMELDGATEWINLNSFAARLVGTELVDWETFPIWSLRDAFEEPFRTRVENDVYDLIAAQWVFNAGKLIYAVSCEESTVENPRITKGGPLFDGESGFNVKRWEFWKKRAQEMKEVVSEDVKGIAASVVEKMVEIEGDT
ncbi:uncharacterized protein N7469_000007, partial [Penicillium citrinum]